MSRIKLEGKRFNKLTVADYSHTNVHRKAIWNCVCDCGKKTQVSGTNLIQNKIKSCGCLRLNGNSATHRKTNLPIYATWANMISRCNNINNNHYYCYGGRGITVCDKWLTFIGFYDDMGDKPYGKTLDRINNNDGYYKENCRWATLDEQANNKNSNHKITYKGITKNLTQWADELGINKWTLKNRLGKYGWSVERSFNDPIGKQHNRKGVVLI